MAEVKKILVVDDEEMIRVNMEAFLEDEGYSVISVSTGEEAIKVIKSDLEIDLVIVDVRLPGIDGSAVVLQSYDETNNIKLKYILHTGSSEYILPQELRSIGIRDDHILFKPLIEMKSLLDLISLLAKRE